MATIFEGGLELALPALWRAAGGAGPMPYRDAVVISMPGVTLVYSPAPGIGTLVMSHSETGSGYDSFGNVYGDGDILY